MLNSPEVFQIAAENTPPADVQHMSGWRRYDVVRELKPTGNIGLELGVARGIFSSRMVASGQFSRYFGVDVYGDIHDTDEYKTALKAVDFKSPTYSLLRMTFDEALDLFEDECLDFVYIDGFAHTGEEGGKTISDWYSKLKVGGVLAGDDYHADWPLVVWAVNHFAGQLGVPIRLTTEAEEDSYSRYPTWFLRKPKTRATLTVDPHLYEISQAERERVHRERMVPALPAEAAAETASAPVDTGGGFFRKLFKSGRNDST